MLRAGVANRRFFQVRGYDFAAMGEKISSVEARKALSDLRASHETAQQFIRDANVPVQKIDWEYYKSIIANKQLVETMEKEWESVVPPVFTDEGESEFNVKVEALFEKAKEMKVSGSARVKELTELIENMEKNKITRDTTVREIAERNPDIAEEAREELRKGDYHKDII